MELNKPVWTQEDYDAFVLYLKSLSDEKYRRFHCSLVPGSNTVIGIRIPTVRSIASDISKGNYESFLRCSIHGYNEEKIIFGLVLAGKKCDYDTMLNDIRTFIELIDNWSVNDTVKFRYIKKYKSYLINDIHEFIYSENPWAQRYGFKILMDFYLDDENIDFVLEQTHIVNSDFYYLQMMQAWLIATAAVNYKEKVFKLFEEKRLNPVTQNMAVRKIRESLRIEKNDKDRAAEYRRHK